MEELLKLEKVCKKYDDFALENISLSLLSGVIMGFIGENGAGKTTTLKSILNLIKIDSGKITLFGKDAQPLENKIKEKIGVVFDESYFHDNLNGKDINLIMRNIYKSWDESEYFKLLERFQLPLNKAMKAFSKGMKMKISIAVALSHHPKLLILDEATSGLDPVIREEILEIFVDFVLDGEHSVLLSSHITSDIEKIADYICFIHQGEIVLNESKDKLLEDYGILKISKEEFENCDKQDFIAFRKHQFSIEVLIKQKRKYKKQFPNAVVDPAKLEEIMLFMIRGEKI